MNGHENCQACHAGYYLADHDYIVLKPESELQSFGGDASSDDQTELSINYQIVGNNVYLPQQFDWYHNYQGKICFKKTCTCTNGRPAIGPNCPINNYHKCSTCNQGYSINTANNRCVKKTVRIQIQESNSFRSYDDPTKYLCWLTRGTGNDRRKYRLCKNREEILFFDMFDKQEGDDWICYFSRRCT